MDERPPVQVKNGDRVRLRRGNIALVNGPIHAAADGTDIYNLGQIAFIRGDGIAPGFSGFDAVEIFESKEAD